MKVSRCLLFGLIVWVAGLWGAPADAVQEEQLAEEFSETIYPYFASEFTFGWFAGVGNKKVHYAVQAGRREKAAIVLVTGRTEHISKYSELLYDLKDHGFSFFIYDHRGQGSSERLLADPQKGYVEDFQDYVEDLNIFLDTVVFPQTNSPVFIVSHSMGGAVSYRYARAYPKRLNGIVLCAPMFSINTAPVPKFIAKFVVKGMVVAGAEKRYIFGGSPFDPAKSFAGNDLTQSQGRFALNKALMLNFPQVALGSPTFGWLDQAFSAMDVSLRPDNQAEDLPPILILSGTEDTVVDFAPQKEMCNSLPDCRIQRIAGAKHELMMEKDEIRDTILRLIVEFVETQLR
jgi:lysophospholipase